MKTICHVDQHIIRRNHKTGERAAPLSVRTYKSHAKANRVEILDKEGNVVACVRYEPEKPLSCGARVWIETQHEVRAIA